MINGLLRLAERAGQMTIARRALFPSQTLKIPRCIVFWISEAGTALAEIARHVGVSTSGIARAVKRPEERSWGGDISPLTLRPPGVPCESDPTFACPFSLLCILNYHIFHNAQSCYLRLIDKTCVRCLSLKRKRKERALHMIRTP